MALDCISALHSQKDTPGLVSLHGWAIRCLLWVYREKMVVLYNIDGLVQYCSKSSALAMELLQSCT